MSDLLWIVGVLAIWLTLQYYLLPKLGVGT
jgi:hypothetical protein